MSIGLYSFMVICRLLMAALINGCLLICWSEFLLVDHIDQWDSIVGERDEQRRSIGDCNVPDNAPIFLNHVNLILLNLLLVYSIFFIRWSFFSSLDRIMFCCWSAEKTFVFLAWIRLILIDFDSFHLTQMILQRSMQSESFPKVFLNWTHQCSIHPSNLSLERERVRLNRIISWFQSNMQWDIHLISLVDRPMKTSSFFSLSPSLSFISINPIRIGNQSCGNLHRCIETRGTETNSRN